MLIEYFYFSGLYVYIINIKECGYIRPDLQIPSVYPVKVMISRIWQLRVILLVPLHAVHGGGEVEEAAHQAGQEAGVDQPQDDSL